MTGEVGDDNAMGRHEIRDDSYPPERGLSRTVKQDDWRAVTTLKNRGRNPGQLQPSFRDGKRIE
ncbi:hypothetical protein [Halorussus halophilus]|uniref:hypothetical protein n=1 Tax=Halorussus halophilus TaxID=2650975 RepID=UPI001CE3F4EC|nr:hypothetical protein [Halorussus halophilus]